MQVLVISDSHGRGEIVDRIIRRHKDARHIFFLGDKVSDIEDFRYEYTDKTFHIVSGNCDFVSEYPSFDMVKLEKTDILFCHGHSFDVKSSLSRITAFAENSGCKLALYGHTHIPAIDFKGGVTLVNPGSVSKGRVTKNTYAIVDITEKEIYPKILEV